MIHTIHYQVAGQLLRQLPYLPLDDDIGPPKPGGEGHLHTSELEARPNACFFQYPKRSYQIR